MARRAGDGGAGVAPTGGRSSVGGLERWAAEARARDAAEARARERWLRTQAAEEATLAGLFLDLAERDEQATVRTTAGNTYGGRVRSVGHDFVALLDRAGVVILVALPGVSLVVPASGGRWAAGTPGDRSEEGTRALGVRLSDVLAQAAGHRPEVSVDVAGATVRGRLRSVGNGLLAIVTGPPERRRGCDVAFVHLQSLSAISLLDSG